jgi:hypothetical protein
MALTSIRPYISPNSKGSRNMKFLKHLGFLGLASALVLAAELSGQKGQAAGQASGLRVTPVSNAAVTAPIRTAYGKVRSIVGQVLVLDVGSADMRFATDENTDVVAPGAGRVTRSAGSGLPITDLVRAGDVAVVAYRESNGSKRVLEIQVKGRKTIASR